MQRRHGLRDLKAAWHRSLPGGSFKADVQRISAADGTPMQPGSGFVSTLNWEIEYPAIVAGGDADWTNYAASLHTAEQLHLFSFASGLEALGAFTKQNLAILDVQVFLGNVGHVTDVSGSFNTSQITTFVRSDDGVGGYASVRTWTNNWPGSGPSGPPYTKLSTAGITLDNCPMLLSAAYPRAYLHLHNNHGSITLSAGRLRLMMMVGEI